VTLFALTEAVSIGRSLAARGGYRIDGNQEFIGQGLSNIAGSFFSGYVATGSFNRSGVNYEAGARTPLAAVFAGAAADADRAAGRAAGELSAEGGDGRRAVPGGLGADRPQGRSAHHRARPERETAVLA
jgi:hypothetical protein